MIDNLSGDQSHLFLTVKNFPEDLFQVLSIDCDNDGLSMHYCFKLRLTCKHYQDPSLFLNLQAVLSWDIAPHQQQRNYRHGVISAVHYYGKSLSGHIYYCELVSGLHILTQQINNRVFVNKSVETIISTVLDKAGFRPYQFRLDLDNGEILQPYTVQFRQTDYEFLNLLLQRFGIDYFWLQQSSSAILYFVDSLFKINSYLSASPISITAASSCYSWANQITNTTKILTTSRDCQVGMLTQINGRTFRIIKIQHQASQPGKIYRAKITLVLPNFAVEKHDLIKPRRILLNAKIESIADDNNAYLDGIGAYFIRMPFDAENTPPTEASKPLIMLQPLGGVAQDQSIHGMHFPLSADTEILLVSLNNDLNQPIILGAVPNPNTSSPVNASNFTYNLIQTRSGNALNIIDTIGQSKINLATAHQQNLLSLDATEDAMQVLLQSQTGEINLYANKILNIYCQDSHIHQSQLSEQITVANQQQVKTLQQDITLNSGRNFVLSTVNNLEIKTATQNLNISTQILNLEIQDNLSWQSTGGNINIQNLSGSFVAFAKQSVFIDGSEIEMQQGSNAVRLSNNQIILQGVVININAQMIRCPFPK